VASINSSESFSSSESLPIHFLRPFCYMRHREVLDPSRSPDCVKTQSEPFDTAQGELLSA
jgi:hypothetical protein